MKPSAFPETLRRILAAAGPHLRGLDESRVSRQPAPGKWSQKEILGHLIDSAANNHQRFVRAQLAAELSFPKYEQDGWVRCQDYARAEWSSLVDLWHAYNAHLAFLAGGIPAAKLTTPCRIGDGSPITLGFLLEDYVQHLQHHLRQLGLET